MKGSAIKIWALVLAIVLPALFIILFKPLGEIPRPKPPQKLYPTGEIVEHIDASGNKYIDSIYHTIPNKVLISQDGKEFVLDSLAGTVYVADFFFTSCPGICPVMTNQLARVQKAFIKDHNFKVISFSVDPARDSIAALREYAKNHNAIPGKWFFLRAEKSDIFSLAKDGFFLIAKDSPNKEEAFIHSEKLTLVDADGNIRGYYDGTDSASVNKMMGDIVLVLRDYEKNYSFRKDKNGEGYIRKGIRKTKSAFN